MVQQLPTNPQDVGGCNDDAHASTASAAVAAEAPLSAAIERSQKAVKFWEYQTVRKHHEFAVSCCNACCMKATWSSESKTPWTQHPAVLFAAIIEK